MYKHDRCVDTNYQNNTIKKPKFLVWKVLTGLSTTYENVKIYDVFQLKKNKFLLVFATETRTVENIFRSYRSTVSTISVHNILIFKGQ